jgi:MFS family permease
VAERLSPSYTPTPMACLSTPRTAIMLVFAGFGVGAGAWAGAVPFVTKRVGVDAYSLGLGFTIAALATAMIMAMGGRIGRYLSNRAALLIALPLVAIATLGLLAATTPVMFFVFLVAQATCLGLCDVFMNAEASAIEHDVRKPIFTAFHGAVSLAMAVAAILSSYLTNLFGPFYMVAIASACLALAWFAVFLNVPARQLTQAGHGKLREMIGNMPLLLIGLIVGISITMETSAMFWSAKLLDEQAPELAKIAGLGVAFYGACNAVVRFKGDRMRAWFGEIPLLIASLGIATIGLLGLGLSFSFAANVIAFAMIGFGLAIICPCLFNMAASTVPRNRAGGIGYISLVAGLPRVLGPYAFGWIAATSSTGTAFGAGAILLIVALALVFLLRAMLYHAPQPAERKI